MNTSDLVEAQHALIDAADANTDTLDEAIDFITDLRATNDMLRVRGDQWKDAALEGVQQVRKLRDQVDYLKSYTTYLNGRYQG
jgi:hypothetical protein